MALNQANNPVVLERTLRGPHVYKDGGYVRVSPSAMPVEYPKMLFVTPRPARHESKTDAEFAAAVEKWEASGNGAIVTSKKEEESWYVKHPRPKTDQT